MADPDRSEDSAPAEEGKPAEPPAAGAGDRALSCVEPPSFSAACSLVSSAHSCLLVKTQRRHLALPPKYLHRKRSGIQEQLSAELLKYNVRLGGVPVAYDNIKIVGEFGDIHDDVGYIHLTVEADYVIFQPQQGQKLVGIVNKVAPSHIGCLVHGCFNASIPKPMKMPVEAWQHVGVKVGDQMEFEVFRLDSDAVGVFCIRGRLERKVEAEVLERFEAAKEQTSEVFDDAQNDPEVSEEAAINKTIMISEDTTKRKPKKRNFQETLPQDLSGEAEGCDVTNTSLEATPKKKLKKKKHQDMVDASVDSASVENTIMDSSCQSIDSTLKKARKKKHRQDSLPVSDIEGIAGTGESSSILSFDEFVVSSSQVKIKKSKKKKHKDDSVLMDHSLQNGIAEELTLLQNETVVKKKTHKKKHKLSSSVQEPPLEATNGAVELTSEGNPPNSSIPQAETSKHKKHKKKQHAHVLPGSGATAHLAEDIKQSIGSQDFAEPKSKKKRK